MDPDTPELPTMVWATCANFYQDQTAAFENLWRDDLFLAALPVPKGLATLTEELNRHKNQAQAGQEGDRIKRTPP